MYLDIATLAVIGENLFSGTSYGVFRSTDNGTNWTLETNGLPDTGSSSNYAITALAVSDTNIFAATYFDGIFCSTNDGASWSSVNVGFPPHTTVTSLTVNDSNLFAGTYGNGVWRRPLSEMVTAVPVSSNELPKKFSLEQNYPNPFNPTATIGYDLPTTSRVSLKVYNLLGQVVATLASGIEEAGIKSVLWNASDFASGVYFYRIDAVSIGDLNKTFTQIKKMVFLK